MICGLVSIHMLKTIEEIALAVSNFCCLDTNCKIFTIFQPTNSLYFYTLGHNFKISFLIHNSLCKQTVEWLPQILP